MTVEIQQPKLAVLGERNGEKFLHVLRLLSPDEVELYRRSVKTLRRLSASQQMLAMVGLNVADYRNSVSIHLARFPGGKHVDLGYAEHIQLDVNRHVLNALAMIEAYLESFEATLKREFGRRSTQLRCLEDSRMTLLESAFSYRLIRLMRGCALHGGLPLVEVSIKSIAVGERGTAIAKDLHVLVDRAEFLSKVGRQGADLRQGIEGLPEKFPIDAYLNDVLTRLRWLNVDVLSVTLPGLVASAELIRGFADECGDWAGFPVVLRYESDTPGDFRLAIEPLPLHLAMPILDALRKGQTGRG